MEAMPFVKAVEEADNVNVEMRGRRKSVHDVQGRRATKTAKLGVEARLGLETRLGPDTGTKLGPDTRLGVPQPHAKAPRVARRGLRRGGDDVDPMTLVAEHRKKLAAQTSDSKRAELAQVQAAVAHCCGKRWLRRREAELQAQAAAIQHEIAKIDAGEHIQEFERAAAPYLERFRRLSTQRRVYTGVTTAGKAGRIVHTGSDVAPNAGAGSAADRGRDMPAVRFAPSATAGDPRQTVLDALRANVLGETPPLYISFGDVCDECGIAMKIIANYSMLGCPACGKTRRYDNMTAAAVGHGTDMDYSLNTYHQKSRLVEALEFTQAKEYADPPEVILRMVMEAQWATRRTALYEHAETIALDVQAHGEYVDAADAVQRLQPRIPDIEALLQADSQASKARRCLRDISRSADTWLPLAHPEAAALTGRARQDAVEKFQDRVRKFYERSPKIAAYIGGYLPLQMRPDQEEYIRRLFIASGAAYDRFRKAGHQNWPGGYPFFIRSILILLGLDEFIGQYPLPTCAKNLRDHETMRKEICKEMDWEYVASSLPLPRMEMLPGEGAKLAALLATFGQEPAADGKAKAAGGKRARIMSEEDGMDLLQYTQGQGHTKKARTA